MPLPPSDLPCVGTWLSRFRLSVLQNVTLAHLGKLIPGILELAIHYGAVVVDSPDAPGVTHLVVTSSDLPTCRSVRAAQKLGQFTNIHVITCSWIVDCARDGVKVSERPYLLQNKFP